MVIGGGLARPLTLAETDALVVLLSSEDIRGDQARPTVVIALCPTPI